MKYKNLKPHKIVMADHRKKQQEQSRSFRNALRVMVEQRRKMTFAQKRAILDRMMKNTSSEGK